MEKGIQTGRQKKQHRHFAERLSAEQNGMNLFGEREQEQDRHSGICRNGRIKTPSNPKQEEKRSEEEKEPGKTPLPDPGTKEAKRQGDWQRGRKRGGETWLESFPVIDLAEVAG